MHLIFLTTVKIMASFGGTVARNKEILIPDQRVVHVAQYSISDSYQSQMLKGKV